MIKSVSLYSIVITCFLVSCEKTEGYDLVFIEGNGVTDADGNNYSSVVIGNQEWMAENLRATLFCNGDTILHDPGNEDWVFYDNDAQYDTVFGKLYNYGAFESESGLCPCGWHVPTSQEFAILIDYLGGKSDAYKKLKSVGTLEEGNGLWRIAPALDYAQGNNLSGFNALPGGQASVGGLFYEKDSSACFWTITPGDPKDEYVLLKYDNELVSKGVLGNLNGSNSSVNRYASVRCIKNYE